jgi:hypothetical protein
MILSKELKVQEKILEKVLKRVYIPLQLGYNSSIKENKRI